MINEAESEIIKMNIEMKCILSLIFSTIVKLFKKGYPSIIYHLMSKILQ